MSTVTHIYDAIDRLAPFWLTMDFDNTGILVGDRNREIACALLALDCTPAVIEQARQLGAQLIITHHPVIFHPLKRVNEDAVVYQLIRSDIAVISAHTNLDIAQGGVNDALASAIGLRDCRGLELLNEQTGAWLGRVGTLPEPLSPEAFAAHIKACLNAASIKFSAAPRVIRTVALCSGSGADCLDAAISAGADALLTSEVKQHEYLAAAAAGISIFDAGHFDTEDIVIEPLRDYLAKEIPDVHFFTTHRSAIQAI
mgnify:FL=1